MEIQSQHADKEATEKKPRVGEIFDLVISNLNEDGYGISHAGKLPVLVSGVLPGETVRVKITFSGHREAFATVIKVLRHSPARLKTPPCEQPASCDGCRFISMKYPMQLDWKRGMVENAIRQYTSLKGVTLHPVLPSPMQLHYRNSARLVITGKFTAPIIGTYRRNNQDVIDFGDCPLYHPLIIRVVAAVKEGIKRGKVPVYSARSGSGLLRYLVVRVSEVENRAMVVFVTAQRSFNEIHHLGKFLQGSVPEVEVIVQNINDSPGKAFLGDKDHFVTRKRTLQDAIGALRFDISPRSFFPANSGASKTAYEKVLEWEDLSGRETVICLYAGSGSIPLYLARRAKTVMGIEPGERGVMETEKNARLNGIRNCRFEAGEGAELLAELRGEGIAPDLIVINTPAKGCGKEVLQQAVLLAPARVILLSGSLLSLVQDLDILNRFGYRTMEVQPMDMFPYTPRVDTLSLMVKE